MKTKKKTKGSLKQKKLTLKEQKLVAAYAKTGNKRQSAIAAGYSARSADVIANETLSKPKVQNAVQEAIAKLNINPEYVFGTIKDTIERCRQAKPVLNKAGEQVFCETPEGDMAPAYRFDSSAVLKGSELLGKHLALFGESKESVNNTQVNIYQVLDTNINENTQKLIDVSPKVNKKGIEGII